MNTRVDNAAGAVATEPALALTGVTSGYGSAVVLRDVDVKVGKGTIDGLIGSNGAGKTTLLRTASGLLPAREGRVEVGGQDLTTAQPHRRAAAGLCMIPEGRGIFRTLSVADNLRLQLPKSADRGRIDRALDSFPVLKKRLGQRAGSLSGGEQQMLALSRCYLSSPSVVLLDEVSMGLAPRIVDQIFESLIALAAEGIALLLVEQYVNRVLEMAETVHILSRGVVSYSGPAAQLDADTVLQGYLGATLPGADLDGQTGADPAAAN